MDLTIIIVNWNGGEILHRCLSSIESTKGKLDVQVIVMDNASRDGSRQMVQRHFKEVTLLNTGANLGFGKANNLARPFVRSDLVLFLNPDTVLLENSLQQMLTFIRAHDEIGALGCKMISQDGLVHEQGLQWFPSPWTELLQSMFLTTYTRQLLKSWLPRLDPNRDSYATKLYGGCLLCRKSALDAVGWFDERYFMYAEDVDLCHSVAQKGWRLYYLSKSQIIHAAGAFSSQAPDGFALLMQSDSVAKLMRKYYGAGGTFLYRLITFVGASVRLGALVILRALSFPTGRKLTFNFPSSFSKQKLLLLWALGFRKPVIGA